MKKTGISLVSIFIVLILHSLVFTANSQVNNSNSDFIKSEVFSEEQQTKDETSSNENKIPVIEIYKSEISCNEFIWSPDSKNFLVITDNRRRMSLIDVKTKKETVLKDLGENFELDYHSEKENKDYSASISSVHYVANGEILLFSLSYYYVQSKKWFHKLILMDVNGKNERTFADFILNTGSDNKPFGFCLLNNINKVFYAQDMPESKKLQFSIFDILTFKETILDLDINLGLKTDFRFYPCPKNIHIAITSRNGVMLFNMINEEVKELSKYVIGIDEEYGNYELNTSWLRWVPSGYAVLVVGTIPAAPGPGPSRVYRISIFTGAIKKLPEMSSNFAYISNSTILCVTQKWSWRRNPEESRRRLLTRVYENPVFWIAAIDGSRRREIGVEDTYDAKRPTALSENSINNAKNKVAFVGDDVIYVIDFSRIPYKLLSSEKKFEKFGGTPIWAPDVEKLAFIADNALYIMDFNDSNNNPK